MAKPFSSSSLLVLTVTSVWNSGPFSPPLVQTRCDQPSLLCLQQPPRICARRFIPNLFKSQAPQAPGGYPPTPLSGGYGASFPNQQSHGLYPQPGGAMPAGPGMGFPGQPGYPQAPSPNTPMAGFGGAPAPVPGYPKAPSPNPSMPGYGAGAMPIAPPVNVRILE